ncbi:methyltransferase-like protein 25B isoform X2 [Ornithodoros turicata]|uniref:methyltransferase-like protein 25B isoform X2 n=1 Tax=Ornithodoros turicata TaxID=34597 RepID=UPI0031394397
MDIPDWERYLLFLDKYSWIYDINMTRILLEETLLKIPSAWAEYISNLSSDELGCIPFGSLKDGCPTDFREFVDEAVELARPRFETGKLDDSSVLLPPVIRRGMSEKKQHEVCKLASLVAQVARETDCSSVLDVGSGLGYLPQVLHSNYSYKVIGIDSESFHSTRANERLQHSGCSQNIHHYTLKLEDHPSSIEGVKSVLRNCPPYEICACGRKDVHHEEREIDDRYIMVALHACGRLTPTFLQIFHQMEQVSAAICIGCCYHKVEDKSGVLQGYFPLSDAIKGLMQNRYPALKHGMKFGLRLACQETRDEWRHQTVSHHERHSRHVFFRAVLQLAVEKYGLQWKKSRRHVARKDHFTSFQTFLEHVMRDIPSDTAFRYVAPSDGELRIQLHVYVRRAQGTSNNSNCVHRASSKPTETHIAGPNVKSFKMCTTDTCS